MLDERDQVVERHGAAVRAGGSGTGRNGGGAARGPAAARAPASSARSKLNGPRPAPGEVARVERLQRVPHDDPTASAGRGRDRVEQLAERHRGRAARPVRSSAPEWTTTSVLGGRA